ncbi:MAG: hypothetical protein OXU45_06490 [Candidatus Melainabacteria bacterium]|nr:hypothetical protein [Candidatus Melainabacteria bacterium]
MQAIENSFQAWMRQAGIIKKLQLVLALSLLLNLALGQEIIRSKFISPMAETGLEQELEAKPQITEAELRDFVETYLLSFFDLSQKSFDFLEDKTVQDLFVHDLRPELVKRRELKLESRFQLDDIYLDSLDSGHAKAICLGREIFNGNYMDRNFNIELIVQTPDLIVSSIPVFKVE